ncbi:FAD-binding oxidoreductase [Actinophytocola gossypii]|uniref:FAD-binding protein n=1 Tax=Actinophytocola gossypii TaxID=2812003 RepID=A0ABT2J831_9PSEU|nr:FAD-dependent oxidoreductase [Actinophytocola gossypii]MCT2583936.1 FAD-binding protein [Actinophytocola gossypii]
MIVNATTPADVRTAVLTAHERRLPLTVYATGHGGPMPTGEDTVVVTTSEMTGVLVDPDRRTARVGAGTRWADVIAAAAPFGLAPLSGTSPTVGVVGYTLGGGLGWLSRRFGFAADSVLRAEIVTADGESRTVTPDQNPDLFWAIRGGGGNFGVVTSLEFRLHPVHTVHAGTAKFSLDRAADILTRYRETAPEMPDALTANIVLTKDSVAIRGMYAGSASDARRALAPLFEVAGTPRETTWQTIPYTESGTVGGMAPRQFTYQAALPDAVIEAAIEAVHGEANGVEFRTWGGAMSRPGADPAPVGHRDVPFSVVIDGPPVPTITAAATGGAFLNWLPDPTRVSTAYTPSDYARLQNVKLTHDPENLFRPVKHIAPATPALARLGA